MFPSGSVTRASRGSPTAPMDVEGLPCMKDLSFKANKE
jgi:hypothetical protein